MAESPGTVHVSIEHADPLLAEGVRQALAPAPGILLREGEADVLVCDYETAMGRLAGRRAGDRVVPLVISRRDGEADVHLALQAGVGGYLLAGCGLDEVVLAVRTVGRGGRHLCDRAASLVAQSLLRTPLTARETEVLRLIADGLSNKQIAMRLDIAVGTVKAHTKAILAKLEAASRTEAMAVAQQRGLLGPPAR